MRDALIVVALAEIPQSNLVEIVQANRPGNTVDEERIGNGHGNDMGQVEFHEVRLAHHGTIRDIANAYQQQEDPGNQIEQRTNEPVREDRRLFPPSNRRMAIGFGGGLAEEGHRETTLAGPKRRTEGILNMNIGKKRGSRRSNEKKKKRLDQETKARRMATDGLGRE